MVPNAAVSVPKGHPEAEKRLCQSSSKKIGTLFFESEELKCSEKAE